MVNNQIRALKKPQPLPSYDTLVNFDNRYTTARKIMRPRHPSEPPSVKQQANDRLAQALRDNLHRRKAQARARKAAPAPAASGKMAPDEKKPVK